MTHLIIHLVEELEICGPMANRWCYPIERYLYVLKKYMRNKAKSKGCIALGYMYDKTLGFCIILYTSIAFGMQMKRKLM
jgi:hypothetical protein